MCKSAIILILVLFFSFSVTAQYRSDTLFFESGSYLLSDIEQEKIEGIPIGEILLEGRTDAQGKSNYNLQLSKLRVQEVKKYLLNKGHPKANINTVFNGELKADEFSEEWKSRCVIVRYENPKDTLVVSFDDYTPTEEFVFKNNQGFDTLLSNGVNVSIAPNSFQGRATDNIVFKITSYLTKVDFILADLQSMAGDSLLESAGMFKLEAYVNSHPTQLRQGKSVDIQVPNKGRKKDFELFNGVHDPHQNSKVGNVDWVLERKSKSSFLNKGSFFIEGDSKQYVINRIDFRFRYTKKNHKSKYFKIYKYRLESALKSQRTPVDFNVFLKIEDGKLTSDSIEIIEGVLSKRVEKKLEKVLLTSDWKKRKNPQAIILNFSYGEYFISNSFGREVNVEDINLDSASLDMVMLKVTQIGWVNCDRFYESKNKKNITVKTDQLASVKMVFKNFDGLIKGVYVNNGFEFGKISADEPFTIIAYKQDGDDVLVAERNQSDYKTALEYTRVTREEFIQLLETY